MASLEHKRAMNRIYSRDVYAGVGKKEVKHLAGGGKVEWNPGPLVVEVEKKVQPITKKIADRVARIARRNVPRGKIRRAAGRFKSWQARTPGSLRKSIKVVKSKYPKGGHLIVVGGTDTYYWFFVNYGTHRFPGTFFMSNALRKAKARTRGLV